MENKSEFSIKTYVASISRENLKKNDYSAINITTKAELKVTEKVLKEFLFPFSNHLADESMKKPTYKN